MCSLFSSVKLAKLSDSWLIFLKLSGVYSRKYFLLEDLSLEGHSPKSDQALKKYYDGDLSKLRKSLRRTRTQMEWNLWDISEIQRSLGLAASFDEEFGEIIHRFSVADDRAARRKFFKKIAVLFGNGEAKPQSLDDLEKKFQDTQKEKAAKRKKA